MGKPQLCFNVDEGMNRLHMEERIQEIQIKNNNIMDGQD
jgi:hypothetical protein